MLLKIAKWQESLLKFVFFVLTFWYITENLHSDLVSISIDIIGSWNAHLRELSTSEKPIDHFMIVLSLLLMLIKLSIGFLFVIISMRPTSKLHFLMEGLNAKKKCWLITYFIHFFFTWLLLSLLVLLTPWCSSKVLLGIAFGLQLLSICVNILKLYSSWFLYAQILIVKETNLLFAILMLFSLQFT